MFKKNISGQRLFFGMVSVVSGNAVYSGGVGSLSGKISGYVTLDGGTIGGVGGFITEQGFGQYVLNGFAADFNGNNIGFLFCTSSGVAPVSIHANTVESVSGSLWIGSGQSTLLYSGQASGQPVNPLSGQTWLASGSSVLPSGGNVLIFSGTLVLPSGGSVGVFSGNLSGQLVALFSGSLSGQPVNPLSGQTWLASGNLSGQFLTANLTQWLGVPPNALISSGRVDAAFNVRTGVATSGTSTTIKLDAGAPTGISGVYDGQVITIVGGTGAVRSRVIQNYDASGIAHVFPPWDASGVPDTTSIFTITPGAVTASGFVQIASGNPSSGQVWLASGSVILPSGGSVGVFSGNLSGQLVTAASGVFANATATVNSGQVWLASGSVILPSGGNVLVFSGSLSGQVVDLNSGQSFLASGGIVLPSGGNVGVFSGKVWPASGLLTQVVPQNVWTINMSGLGTSGLRQPIQGMRKLTNKIDTASGLSGKLVVYQEDDTTIASVENIASVDIQSGQGITSLAPS